MESSFINVARGPIVDQAALTAARGEVPRDVVNREVLDRSGFWAKLRRWGGG